MEYFVYIKYSCSQHLLLFVAVVDFSDNIDNSGTIHKYYVRTDYNNAWFAELNRDKCGDGVITEAVSVSKMHEFCREALKAGNECFIAGISEV